MLVCSQRVSELAASATAAKPARYGRVVRLQCLSVVMRMVTMVTTALMVVYVAVLQLHGVRDDVERV